MATEEKPRGFMARFMPPEHDFYGRLQEHAAKAEEATEKLVHWLHTGEEASAERVREVEHEADQLREQMMDELAEVFSTPLDREDLLTLSRRLDEFINYTKDIVREMQIFEIGPDRGIRDMAELLLDGARELRQGFQALENEPEAAEVHAKNAKKAENRVEKAFRLSLKELFSGDDMRDILLRRETYRHISNTADRLDEVADMLWMVAVKYH